MSLRPTFDSGFSTPELAAIFTPDATLSAMLEFEAALALALADTGLAPADEAEEVAEACRMGIADPEEVLASTWETGTPMISLRAAMTASIRSESARKWFHHGATTQDAVDTGQMIQARMALGVIGESLESVARRLRDLTLEFRDQPQMGRTFLQDAIPTTFGFRTARWLDAVLDHIDEVRRTTGALPVQLGGPVGTGAEYGDMGSQVVEAVATRLDLRPPVISWHSNRSPVVSLAQMMERVALTMSRIGSDMAQLASSAIAEITVRSGGSSSMPGKRNPVDAVRAVAASGACSGTVAMLVSGRGQELDRGVGGWHVERLALPLALQTGGAAIAAVDRCLASLEVDREAMSAHAGDDVPTSGAQQIDDVLASFDRLLG